MCFFCAKETRIWNPRAGYRDHSLRPGHLLEPVTGPETPVVIPNSHQ